MANNVLPEELMLCILGRLPVKTIIRFKSVCKPWFHLFSTPEFKKLHQTQFSSDPKNQSFIFHSKKYRSDPRYLFSIFNIESGEKMPTILDHPFAHSQKNELDFVGCCNGLVCIHSGQEIVLWNPAMKLSKTVALKEFGHLKEVSLGFGYDAMGDDFKVVMIVEVASTENITSVEIYSANLDSWVTIDVGFQFHGIRAKKELIVNGNPYWGAWVDGIQILVCFDVLELVFKIVPMPTTYGPDLLGLDQETDTKIWTDTERDVELVDWNGAPATLVIDYEVDYCVG
ncbi:hypothetical protein CASFOL_013260 [Castilleja foliolosa]|uniref:F-box domain-containing protein n=1 Tax=Castilleja foliolosa TaxID=1961234 RepID=A0ABD3DNK0_9LAMI